jgi:hypothetical protein
MSRIALACSIAALALACAATTAGATPPSGFSAARTIGANLQVNGPVAAADALDGQYAAVAFADHSGRVWAVRVRPDGTLGSPLPAGEDQPDVRDVQVAATEKGEIVVVWAALANHNRSAAVRYAVAEPGRSFSGARTLATVGSNTSATPRIAALRGGTVAVIFRDTHPPSSGGVLRYARRAPHGSFGPARSLGHDGVSPEIAASPGGGALLAWARGSLGHRALEVASAQRGAALSGKASSVAGSVRDITLAASSDGAAWVTWTRRTTGPTTGYARRTRAHNKAAVGPVQQLGMVAYGVPRVALGLSGRFLAVWNAVGPGVSADVGLSAVQGTGAAFGAPHTFQAGGFAQTTPAPALRGATPLVFYTRQIGSPSGESAEAVAADPVSGDGAVLGGAANIATPAVAHIGVAVLAAWTAAGGGVAVTVGH